MDDRLDNIDWEFHRFKEDEIVVENFYRVSAICEACGVKLVAIDRWPKFAKKKLRKLFADHQDRYLHNLFIKTFPEFNETP